MVWIATGTAMRKMIRSTNITSTSGVVLMSDMGVSSPPPVEIAIAKSYPLDFACLGEGGGDRRRPLYPIKPLQPVQQRQASQVRERQEPPSLQA